MRWSSRSSFMAPERGIPSCAVAFFFVGAARNVPALHHLAQKAIRLEPLPVGARHVLRPYGSGTIRVLNLVEEFKRLREFFGRCSHASWAVLRLLHQTNIRFSCCTIIRLLRCTIIRLLRRALLRFFCRSMLPAAGLPYLLHLYMVFQKVICTVPLAGDASRLSSKPHRRAGRH